MRYEARHNGGTRTTRTARICLSLFMLLTLVGGIPGASVFAFAATGTPFAGTIAAQPPRRGMSAAPAAQQPTATPTNAALIPRTLPPRDINVPPQPATRMPGGVVGNGTVVQPDMRPTAPSQPGLIALQPPRHDGTATHFARGVNLPPAFFNSPYYVPGVKGTNYEYPSADDLDYFKSKGMTLFRVAFSWERMQPTLFGPLDATQLGYMDTLVAAAHARDVLLILDLHNYDRYRIQRTSPPVCDNACVESQEILVGTASVPNSALADFWQKFAAHYAGESAVSGYDLMNEPHDTGGTWPATAQAAATAVRQVDHGHTIIVEGDNYAGGSTWTSYNENLAINDPDNNLLYSAHVYFDADASGSYNSSYDASGATTATGVERTRPFVDWLNRHHVRGYVGEYGVPNNDARWLTTLDNFLTYLDANAISGTYWSAGPFQDGYPLSVNPVNGVDAPQMATLVQHLGR